MKQILILTIFSLINLTFSVADAYTASDMIGQLGDDDTPVYTRSSANNGVNRRGLNFPHGAEIDVVNHRLFIADSANNRVLVYNLDSNNLLLDRAADGVLGQANLYTNYSGTTQATMNQPLDVTLDTNNHLFVADSVNNRILVYDVSSVSNGENAVNVLGQANFTASSSAATQAGLNLPNGLSYDNTTNLLYVSDTNNNRVVVYDVTAITDGENAVNVLGQPDFTTVTASTTQSKINNAHRVEIDATNHRLFVADYGNRRVLVFDVTTISDGENSVNVLGQANFTASSSAVTQNGMAGPAGLTYDSVNNRLFVSDHTNNRVVVYDVTAITDGENAINVLGQPDFTTATAQTTQVGMYGPEVLLLDSVNNLLYVPENLNHRVTVFDVTAIINGEAAVNVLGQLNKDDTPVYTKNTVQK